MNNSKCVKLAASALMLLFGAHGAGAASFSESGFEQVYKLDLLDNADYNTAADISYAIDNSASIVTGSFSRAAYYLELGNEFASEYVWASFDTHSSNAADLGVPVDLIFDQAVANMNVFSNSGNVTTGLGFNGKIEFWSNCYVTGGDGIYSHDDAPNAISDCYGSLQIHNLSLTPETVLAYNAWAHPYADDLTIGQSAGPHPDATFARNSGSFQVKTLEVWVDSAAQVPEIDASKASIVLALLLGLLMLRREQLGVVST